MKEYNVAGGIQTHNCEGQVILRQWLFEPPATDAPLPEKKNR